MKFVVRVTSVALAFAVTLLAVSPGGARGYRSRTVGLAPGVTLTKITDPKGPWRIRVVSAALSGPSTIEPVLATGRLPGFETTSPMAARYGALAAINGDYARPSGRPVMLFAQDGELAQTALTFGVNFAVNSTETAAYIKHQKPSVWLEDQVGFRRTVDRFNGGWPGPPEIAGFSSLGGRDEPPPAGACSARMYATEAPRTATSGVGVEQAHLVESVACKERGRVWPRGGRVFATPIAGSRAGDLTSMAPGQTVRFGWSLGWPDVVETIGGNPTLVRDGEIFVERTGYGPFFDRHPRTGVGITPDGRVLFVTVDGRRPGYSLGMTPWRFARLFISLGASYALNLDGGGSTTMVVDDAIVNRPSDGYERPVSSALLLLPGPDPAPTATPGPLPSPSVSPSAGPSTGPSAMPSTGPTASPSPSPASTGEPVGMTAVLSNPGLTTRDVWLSIVSDPASTGGLAHWLFREGVRLNGPLERVARNFARR